MPWMVLAVTYAVLKFTLPAWEPDSGCVQSNRPESRIAFCWIETRPDVGPMAREWRLGVRGDSLMNGKQITFGIPKEGPLWFRVVPVDSAGNEPECLGNEVRVP